MHPVSMLPEVVLTSCGFMQGLLEQELPSSGSVPWLMPVLANSMALRLLASSCCCSSDSCWADRAKDEPIGRANSSCCIVCMQLLSMCCPSTSGAMRPGAETCTAEWKAQQTKNVSVAGPRPHWVQSAVVQLVLPDGAACAAMVAQRLGATVHRQTKQCRP